MEIEKVNPNSPTPKKRGRHSEKWKQNRAAERKLAKTYYPDLPQVVERVEIQFVPHNCQCTWAERDGIQYLKYRHSRCPAKLRGEHK